MKIRQIEDNDPELYSLIAPLVMNPKVLKSNNNYPFKNGNYILIYTNYVKNTALYLHLV